MTYLDTHVVVCLYSNQPERLSPAARRQIESDELAISPMVLVEMELLHEIRRLRAGARKIAGELALTIGLRTSSLPLQVVAEKALGLKWVRDPFDRLIVANAAADDSPLISKDELIRAHYPRAIW